SDEPACCTTPTKIDFLTLSKSEFWDLKEIIDVHFNRRGECDIVVMDEEGDARGFAATVASVLMAEGICRSVKYLDGGLLSFSETYPMLTSHIPVHIRPMDHPKDTNSIDNDTSSTTTISTSATMQQEQDSNAVSLLHPDPHLFPHLPPSNNPVNDLRERQMHLISAVWYGKIYPVGDLPIPIVPNLLYLSSCFAARDDMVKSRRIRHVIRLGWGFEDMCQKGGEDGVTYHDFPIEDSPRQEIRNLFEETTAIIEEARKKGEAVLVHCHAGVSRSSTIVLAYLLKYHRMTLKDAFS
ncbi:Dual specificity protein phosphatase 1, partial [Blyttiomyces sp. JEL0837]